LFRPRVASAGPRLGTREDEPKVLVKVLGSAQDGGIPHLGCRCPNCRRARNDPKEARRIASLAVADLVDRKLFLVDATPDMRLS
jgi:pyrroloquinoline quinone biosynthesis protein B